MDFSSLLSSRHIALAYLWVIELKFLQIRSKIPVKTETNPNKTIVSKEEQI